MAKTHTTTGRDGNGRPYETKTTVWDSGGSKSVTRDTTNRTVFSDGKITSISTTDRHGNRNTKKY